MSNRLRAERSYNFGRRSSVGLGFQNLPLLQITYTQLVSKLNLQCYVIIEEIYPNIENQGGQAMWTWIGIALIVILIVAFFMVRRGR